MGKFIQFELWKECRQGCRFCCNKGQAPIDKVESCKYVLEKLNELNTEDCDAIGLIGGEFFNGELEGCQDLFQQIINRIAELKPSKIFVATSLIYDIREYLLPFLKNAQELNILDRIVLCTSWDVKYRFHSEDQRLLWSRNMLRLINKFPSLQLHVEMILTQHLIDYVVEGGFNIDVFRQVFRCGVDFIEPSSGLFYTDKYECQKDLPGFFPTKSSFIKFLQKVKNYIDLDTLLSMDIRSDELYFLENGNRRVATNRHETDGRCELSDTSKKYDIGFIDVDDKMRDIVIAFKEEIGG